MQDLLRRYIENGLQDFKGLRISGSIPVKDAVLNEAIAGLLAGARSNAPTSPAAGDRSLDLSALRTLVKRAEVRADAGVVTIAFEIAVD